MNNYEQIYNPTFVKNLFDRMSHSYERMNYITSFGFSILWRKQFIAKLNKSKDKEQIIDLLSGLGENWKLLRKRYPNANIDALDFSDTMITHSQLKNNKHHNGKIKLFQEDILDCKLADNYYDKVFCAFGLKTFDEYQLGLLAATVSRILKKGGTFSFIEISQPTSPLLLAMYKLYLKRIIPILGTLFLANPSDYRMLWIYTEEFCDASKIIKIFEQKGLEVSFNSYFYGCATGISGRKL